MDVQGWVLTNNQHRFLSTTQKGFTKDAAKAYIFWGTQQEANEFFQAHPLGIKIRGIQRI